MKVICKVLTPFTENGAYYPVNSEIMLERKRAGQMGDIIEILREVEEKVKIVKKAPPVLPEGEKKEKRFIRKKVGEGKKGN